MFTMTEEHQLRRANTSRRARPAPLFNSICGGCHGSLTGSELDMA